jgi:two-component system alkaline phosphatase synthesis response regulator PhoP
MTRILLVEDDADLAFSLEDDLKVEGYEVEIARDGEAASRRGREGEWDLILLDIVLPRKDGYEVCRELRRAGIRTPVIMLTAKSQEAEKVMGLDIGADDYITKPFSPRELRARIRALLRRTEAPAADVYGFGDVKVDFARGEIRRGEKMIEATALELKLLKAFVDRRGRILSRRQLLDTAWGDQTFVTDRVVDSHVMELRRKIEPDPAKPRYLVSVRGLGYRFDG